MTPLDRIFLAITAVILLVIAGIVAWTVAGNVFLFSWLTGPRRVVDGALIVVLLVLLAVYLVLMLVRRDVEKAVVHRAELGEVRIGVTSIKGLIAKKARELDGVLDVVVKVFEADPLKVRLDVQVLPDHHIPELSEALQSQVRDYLRDTVGIEVTEVHVYVRGIISEAKARLS